MHGPSASAVGTGNRDLGVLLGDGDRLDEKEPAMLQAHTARRLRLALGGGVLLVAFTTPGVTMAASSSGSCQGE